MLFSERSQAPSEKSQHAPLDPERGELEAVERKRRETSNHFSKEGKKGKEMEEKEGKDMEEMETLGCLHITMCVTAQ